MPFIRLCDSYIDHPKFIALSASAFRLWHEGMAYCRRHQTDGGIPVSALTGFRHFQPARVKELTALVVGEGGPLWETVPGGYQVRNYLNWNLSREEDADDKKGSRARSQRWRDKRFRNTITNGVGDASRDAHERNRIRSESTNSSNDLKPSNAVVDSTIEQRASKLLSKYAEIYPQYCHGARLSVVQSPLEFSKACELCATWDDARLEKLIRVFLKAEDDWIESAGRSFKIFASKAQWCDEKLAAYDAKRRPA